MAGLSNEEKTKELLKIKQKFGAVTAENVVREAQDAGHPLHGYFEWDDNKAAHSFRLGQARALIRGCLYQETVNLVSYDAPRFVRDPAMAEHEQGYQDILEIRRNANDARATCMRELKMAIAALRRALRVAGMLGIHQHVSTALNAALAAQTAAQERPDAAD